MPNSCCDLHLHTYYSDGRASPAEMLHQAADLGLKTLAITDHDNFSAYPEAARVAGRLGLELLPGIELTCRWDTCLDETGSPLVEDVDLLGYLFDPLDEPFRAFTKVALADLSARIEDCCTLLTAAGYPVTLDDVYRENPRYPGTMQLIAALWHKGYAGSWNEAFPLFAPHWPKVRLARLEIGAAIAALHAAGGVAILAHPVALRCEGRLLREERLAELVDLGLDGLEIAHPRHDAAARQHFQALAQRFGLLETGGSDEHAWPHGFARLGSELVTYEQIHALRQRASQLAGQATQAGGAS